MRRRNIIRTKGKRRCIRKSFSTEQRTTRFRLPEDWRTHVSELVNANGKRRNAEADRRTLTERFARVTKQFQWGDISEVDYVQQRDEIKAGLAALKTPEAKEIIVAADYMQNMARVWQEATDEERRDMTRAILDEVVCDPEIRRLIALRPKPAFRLLFRQIRGLVERDGAFEIT
jgi:hypothetical protein